MCARLTLLLLLLAAPGVVRAEADQRPFPSTPLGAQVLAPDAWAVGGSMGFPYLSVQLQRGFTESVDASLFARTAWINTFRLGAGARWQFAGSTQSATALRTAWSWGFGPSDETWRFITGEHDLTGALGLVHSWKTARGTVLSVDGSLLLIGSRAPQLGPLGGANRFLFFGGNGAARITAEIPSETGLLLAFELGVDVHLSGFDEAFLMPAFAVGVGFLPP